MYYRYIVNILYNILNLLHKQNRSQNKTKNEIDIIIYINF